MEAFKLCVLETPYAGDVNENVEYAQKCMHDMLLRHEAPYASHLLYTQPNVLDDSIPEERELGIYAGFAFKHMEGVHTVFYVDRGMSNGMNLALEYCKEHDMSYEFRELHHTYKGEIIMFPKQINYATNTELLNQLIENVIPEFNSKPEHRNTFIEGNKLMRWVDGKSIYHMPTKVELREISDKELAVWDAYVKMVEVLSDLDKES